MAMLELFLLFVLEFKGISGEDTHFYHKVGENVVLPCGNRTVHSCSSVDWLYNNIVGSNTNSKVQNGNVYQRSGDAARLRLDSRCSLIIRNITGEDAGRYTCRPGKGVLTDRLVHLIILSISPSQPGDDPSKDEHGDLTLQCSLWKYLEDSCQDGLFWVDDKGTKLVGQDVTKEQKVNKQIKCVSSLTVKHQTGSTSKYTCKYFQGNNLKIEALYSPASTDPTQKFSINVIGPVVAEAVLLLSVIAAVLIKCRRRTKESEDQESSHSDVKNPNYHIHQNKEPQSNLTYATVDHFNPKAPQKKRVKSQEDEVTYSAIKHKMEREEEMNPSSFYSCVTTSK